MSANMKTDPEKYFEERGKELHRRLMEPDICKWKQDANGEWNLWDTDCGETFSLEAETPKENKMVYCCFCGRKIKEVLASN